VNKGDVFSSVYQVDKDLYSGFINLFKDKNPLHTDKAFARKKGFRDVVMYGNILNGFISHFIGENLPIKNVIIHSQEIKFVNPFFLGDSLELKSTISEYYYSVNVAKFEFQFLNKESVIIAKGKIQIGII
jgi:3-hydroxybutyryl-CoA dehydratase